MAQIATKGMQRSDGSAGKPIPLRPNARIATTTLVVAATATIACAAIGLTLAHRDENRKAAEQHVVLEQALNDLNIVSGSVEGFHPGELPDIARRAGLDDLRFDADLVPDGTREAQSVHDAQGRIIGWFNWLPDRALAGAMQWLWSIVAVIGVVLLVAALLARRRMRRLGTALADALATAHRLATLDALTGLPNRQVMLTSLEDAMETRGTACVAFALVDIDSFHEINDTLGRAGGDAMLVAIAERLKAVLPPDAFFARYEDDAFAVIVKADDPAGADKLAAALPAALQTPIFMDQMWQVGVSAGVVQAPEDGITGEELVRRATLALRAAKHAGRGTARRFVPQIQEAHSERRFFRRELEAAIVAETLEVHYQPMVAAAGGGLVGVEALLRWTHPTRGLIPPSMFIPLAEESGLMIRLGEFVLRRALADGARWEDFFVSVNLSPVQVRDPGLVDCVRSALAQSGMAASRLVLEVTESILIDDPQETHARLDALRALGVATALDDFGSGYSSLSYLQKFPFDRLKIDRGFVASLGTSATAGAIIQSIVTLGHALGMKVLAEGVETDEQRVLLRLAGCDELQGFLFAKPCPAAAIDKLLERSLAARAGARGAGGPLR